MIKNTNSCDKIYFSLSRVCEPYIYRNSRASYVPVKRLNTNDANSTVRFYSVILKLCSTSDDILRSTTQAALLFALALLMPFGLKGFHFSCVSCWQSPAIDIYDYVWEQTRRSSISMRWRISAWKGYKRGSSRAYSNTPTVARSSCVSRIRKKIAVL